MTDFKHLKIPKLGYANDALVIDHFFRQPRILPHPWSAELLFGLQ